MAYTYSPGEVFQAGQITSVSDPNDAATPTKQVSVPVVAMATASGATAPAGTSADPTFTNASNSPSTSTSSALTRVFTTTVQGSLIVKASAGNLYGYNIVSGGSAGYLMIFDSATVPAEGTVTPKLVLPIAANAGIQSDRDIPIRFTSGIVMVFSTTGPFTKTISNTAFLAGDAA